MAAAAGSSRQNSSIEEGDALHELQAQQQQQLYLNSGLWKEVVAPAPADSEAVPPFSRVSVAYTISTAVPKTPAAASGGGGDDTITTSPSHSSPNSSTDDLYGDVRGGAARAGASYGSSASRQPPLHAYGESPHVLDRQESIELHITGGDPLTPLMPGLDVGIASMRVGEESVFVVALGGRPDAAAKGSAASTPHFAIRVKVNSFSREIDLSDGQRLVVKHVIKAGSAVTSSAGVPLTPIYDATVRYILQEQHLLTGAFVSNKDVDTRIGGAVTPEWLDTVLKSMCAGEFATVLVAGKATYRVLLRQFTNPPVVVDDDALAIAKRLRTEGNEMFQTRHSKTQNTYQAALFYTQANHYPRSMERLAPALRELKAVIYQNMGLVALLRSKDYTTAVANFTTAIQLCPEAPKFKMFFNRAKAYRMKKEFDAARSDYITTEQLLHAAPSLSAPSTPTTSGVPVAAPGAEIQRELQRLADERAAFEFEHEAWLLSSSA